jgi:hypothetical protein
MDDELNLLRKRLIRICNKYEVYEKLIKSKYGKEATVEQRVREARLVSDTLLQDIDALLPNLSK